MNVFHNLNEDIFRNIREYLEIYNFNTLSITNKCVYRECKRFKTFNLNKELSMRFVRDEDYRKGFLSECLYPEKQIKLNLQESDITNEELKIFDKIKVCFLLLSKCERILNVDCLSGISNLDLSDCWNIKDVSSLRNVDNLNLDNTIFYIVEERSYLNILCYLRKIEMKKDKITIRTLKNVNNLEIGKTNYFIGKKNFSKNSVADYIENKELFDNKTNSVIRVYRLFVVYDNYSCLSVYSNIDYLDNKQIAIIHKNCIHIVDFTQVDKSRVAMTYCHNFLIFDKDISFCEIINCCKLYFYYCLLTCSDSCLLITKIFESKFEINENIDKNLPISFDLNNKKIDNIDDDKIKSLYLEKYFNNKSRDILDNNKIKEHEFYTNNKKTSLAKYGLKNVKYSNIEDNIKKINLVDNNNNNIKINFLKASIIERTCLSEYKNIDYLNNKKIVLLSNYLYYSKRKNNFTFKLLSNPIVHVIEYKKTVVSSLTDTNFRYDTLIFDEEVSLDEILKSCQLYFGHELKKYNFPKKIIKKLGDNFNIADNICIDEPIIFDIDHKKINNNLQFDRIIREYKKLTYLDNKNM